MSHTVCVYRSDGRMVVIDADHHPLIDVAPELLENSECWNVDAQVLTLDTAREYRYRWTGRVRQNALIFERITDA
jgi:hypothetical protein